MLKQTSKTYIYDGSFRGLLCCAARCISLKELPIRFQTDCICLFDTEDIITTDKTANDFLAEIFKKMGGESVSLIKSAFLSEFADIETVIIKFLDLGWQFGKKITTMLSDSDVAAIISVVKKFNREVAAFVQFLRFNNHEGALIATIEPNCNVLPLVASHFATRLPNESFLIYDKCREIAAVHTKDIFEIVDATDFSPLENYDDKFSRLWRIFYNTVEIKHRHNERCQNNFLPKKYRKHMTEFL